MQIEHQEPEIAQEKPTARQEHAESCSRERESEQTRITKSSSLAIIMVELAAAFLSMAKWALQAFGNRPDVTGFLGNMALLLFCTGFLIVLGISMFRNEK